jgi:hypothetical protein
MCENDGQAGVSCGVCFIDLGMQYDVVISSDLIDGASKGAELALVDIGSSRACQNGSLDHCAHCCTRSEYACGEKSASCHAQGTAEIVTHGRDS